MRFDSVLAGFLIGLAVPFVAYAVLLTLNGLALDYFTDFYGLGPKGLSVIAICANLIPFNLMKKHRYDEGMRGIVFSTLFYVFGWMYKFGLGILGVR